YLTRLLELVVFNSYLNAAHNSDWWREKIGTVAVSGADPVQSLARDILLSAVDYQDASGKKPPNYQGYAHIAATLDQALSQCEGQDVAPILRIVALDYLGLAERQMSFNPGLGDSDKKPLLDKAAHALTECLELAKTYDDPALPLWQGYSQFN